jgi:hypothetical protein
MTNAHPSPLWSEGTPGLASDRLTRIAELNQTRADIDSAVNAIRDEIFNSARNVFPVGQKLRLRSTCFASQSDQPLLPSYSYEVAGLTVDQHGIVILRVEVRRAETFSDVSIEHQGGWVSGVAMLPAYEFCAVDKVEEKKAADD